MTIQYVIRNTRTMGYWNSKAKDFRGYLYATKFMYDTDVFIKKDLKEASDDEDCEIVKVYSNE